MQAVLISLRFEPQRLLRESDCCGSGAGGRQIRVCHQLCGNDCVAVAMGRTFEWLKGFGRYKMRQMRYQSIREADVCFEV